MSIFAWRNEKQESLKKAAPFSALKNQILEGVRNHSEVIKRSKTANKMNNWSSYIPSL